MSYVPDNYDMFCQHDAQQEQAEKDWLARLPLCEDCEKPIRDEECFKIGDMLFCPDCMEQKKVYTENYMRG